MLGGGRVLTGRLARWILHMARCRYCGKELKPGQREDRCPERPCQYCGEPLRGRREEDCKLRTRCARCGKGAGGATYCSACDRARYTPGDGGSPQSIYRYERGGSCLVALLALLSVAFVLVVLAS